MEVWIKIPDPILRSFIRCQLRHEDHLRADMSTLTGTVICSLVRVADRPTPLSDPGEEWLRIALSRSRYNDSLRGKPLYLPEESQEIINVVLKREFDITFTAFCSEARVLRFKLKDTIEQFIAQYLLDDLFEGDIETLKKRYYRYELSTYRQWREKLRQHALYAARKIKFAMRGAAIY